MAGSSEEQDQQLQRARPKRGPSKCHHCGRTFTRTEHLQRHLRTHTHDAPFACPYCNRRFQRSDVQVRHVANNCSQRHALTSGTATDFNHRARVACDHCHRKKLRCHGNSPCSNCEKAGRPCVYSRIDRTGTIDSAWQESGFPASNSELRQSRPPPYSAKANNTAHDGLASNNLGEQSVRHQAPQFPLGQGREGENRSSTPALAMNLRSNAAMTTNVESHPLVEHLPSGYTNMISSALPPNFAKLSQAPVTSALQNQNSSTQQVLAIADAPAIEDWDMGINDYFQGFDTNLSGLFPFEHDMIFSEPLGLPGYNFSTPYQPGSFAFAEQEYCTDSAQAALTALEEQSRFSRASSPQSRQEATRWLLTFPTLQSFNTPILNCFLTLFMKHVAPTFCSFQGFNARDGATPSKILAMAAVGGLFCATNGSFTVARAMCSDARRLILTQTDKPLPSEQNQQVCMVQSYLLVELFGTCSGDKRLYECSEAFHMHLLQTLYRCQNLHPATLEPTAKASWQRLLQDLYMLECYRVILFQRPPNLYPITSGTLHLPMSATDGLTVVPDEENMLLILRALMTPDHPLAAFRSPQQSLRALSALLIFSWHSLPNKSPSIMEEGLWKRTYFVLALNRWRTTCGSQVDHSTMLLFHLATIALHTNMAAIHNIVHTFLTAKPFVANFGYLKDWRRSDDSKIAVLHAKMLMEAARRITAAARAPRSRALSSSQGAETVFGEGPHSAICVYLAASVLWAAEVSSEQPDWTNVKTTLQAGCNVLSDFKVRIATVFSNILKRLEEKAE